MQLGQAAFEELVGQALDQIPPGLADLMDNVVILIEDQAPQDPHLLGLYEGVPLTERGSSYVGLDLLPDRITLFREPILAMCSSVDELVEEVKITVVHEVAHHFGIDDERLHQLGWA